MTKNKSSQVFASEGVRQKGKPSDIAKHTLLPNDAFVCTRYPNVPVVKTIKEGTIGIVHDDIPEMISVIRDDCQAARRWTNKKSNENK